MHGDVIKWKHFLRYWPFVRGIHRSPLNSPHKVQWRGALMFSLFCARINGWVNNREAGDLRRHHAHYDVIVMVFTQNTLDVSRLLFPKSLKWSTSADSHCWGYHIEPCRVIKSLQLIKYFSRSALWSLNELQSCRDLTYRYGTSRVFSDIAARVTCPSP